MTKTVWAWWTSICVGTVATALLVACEKAKVPEPSPSEVFARYTMAPLPRQDPSAPAWARAREHVAKLVLQDVTEPRLLEPGVEAVKVKALHDGRSIAFRLEWIDATRDAADAPGRSSDAAAVQVPVAAGTEVPDSAMGARGKPVRIHLWKAAWENGRTPEERMKALYPNAANDPYPFESVKEADRAAAEARYHPAIAVGNPVSVRPPGSAVQDAMAEGFGTLTASAEQTSAGKGVWKDGAWHLVVTTPIPADATAALAPGKRTYAALAVWDGAKGNVGSKKMRSNWISLVLEEAR